MHKQAPQAEKNEQTQHIREVIDPVTHLPVTIHNYTSEELEQIYITPHSLRKDLERSSRKERLGLETADLNRRHADMEQAVEKEVLGGWWNDSDGVEKTRIRMGVSVGSASVGATCGLIVFWLGARWMLSPVDFLILGIASCITVALSIGTYLLCPEHLRLQDRLLSKSREFSVDRADKSRRCEESRQDEENPTESAAWMNSLLHSLWPIVNPALFASAADMLEESLKATFPKLIREVRVAEMGQGAESIRILGIRWLGAGEASEEMDNMPAEEGDFFDCEVAVAYRGRTIGKDSRGGPSGNAHLLVEFSVLGGLVLPVWAELTGLLANVRMRIQLIPNPPFLSLLTATLVGQPKTTVTCTPLVKNLVNIMDVPGLSGLVQSSIGAAIANYVSPRSLQLDLKTTLMGPEKVDTDTVGVVVLTIRSAEGFREGDSEKLFKPKGQRKGDPYVTVGWKKWGKPLWSTRIIGSEGDPIWEETAILLVGPAEMNAEESVQLQLWDCDRLTADDLLGTVHVPLKNLMTDSQTCNEILTREDQLSNIDGSECQGKLTWECGYFSKITLEQHLAKREEAQQVKQQIENEVREDIRRQHARRYVTSDVGRSEEEILWRKTAELIAKTKPLEEWPSGVLSVQIEQISSLEIQKSKDNEDEEADSLPSAYCAIIINHQQQYKTKTKRKTAQPFFDATTEQFIRDWRNTIVIIAVRDARKHRNDPFLGAVVLPLQSIFTQSSHMEDTLPLVGGIGHGKMRLSLTFRSMQVRLPKRLLGWGVGTLAIQPLVCPSSDLAGDLKSCVLVFRTNYDKRKMTVHQDGNWKPKRNHPIHLAVNKRYSSCLLIEFRKHIVGPDTIGAFSTLWLKDILDQEDIEISLPVYKDQCGALERARTNCTSQFDGRVGSIRLVLRFCPGLGGPHRGVAEENKNVADVMEVLHATRGLSKSTQPSSYNGDGDCSGYESGSPDSDDGNGEEIPNNE